MKRKSFLTLSLCGALLAGTSLFTVAQDDAKKGPEKAIKALLVTGGGYHDYKAQKDILTKGISERANVEWEIIFADAKETKAALSKEGWADSYDVVVYNLCHAHETDKEFVASIAKIHAAGKPAVAIHCSMHSYHWKIAGETKEWPALLGVTSPRHGKKSPIKMENTKADHPIMKDFPKEWTTPEGELYHIDKTWDTATVLARGTIDDGKKYHDCVWINDFGKGRVFGTTVGHHNSTMEEDTYLNLITNGVLWVTGNLEEK